MCGIVGYVGNGGNSDTLLTGLRRLEYRGYDSAGISFLQDGRIETVRSVGYVGDLALRVGTVIQSPIGIGHTRWATHGGVTEENAHPHVDSHGLVSVVHNGIIENYTELRDRLKLSGVTFVSQTDTEVIAQMLGHLVMTNSADGNGCQSPSDMIMSVMKLLHGTFGLAVIFRSHPNTLFVARRGSPLIVGAGTDCCLVASDPNALLGWTDRFVTLDDNEIAEVTPSGWKIRHVITGEVARASELMTGDSSEIELGTWPHFMLKEIYEQADAVRRCSAGRFHADTGTARMSGLGLSTADILKFNEIGIIGCGTSYHAGLIGKMLFEQWAGIRARAEVASELRYSNPIVSDDSLFFAVSQSGETADTLGAIKEVRARGAHTLGIVNVVGSSVARACHGGTYIHSGPEISVASTKAFTSQVTALMGAALLFGRTHNMPFNQRQSIVREILEMPETIERSLKQCAGDALERAVKTLLLASNASFVGRGVSFPVALEGALKLRELAYIAATGYPAGELKHGPIAILSPHSPVIAVAPSDGNFEKTVSNLEEAAARGAPVIAVCNPAGEKRVVASGFIPLVVEQVQNELLSPLLTVLPLQLLAYRVAVALGHNVDRPRNLAKSVTVE